MGKYKIDENNPDTYVISKLDNKKYSRITHKHTKKFGISLDEYKNIYNVNSTDIISKLVYESCSFTKKKAIELYGIIEGTIKWDNYRKKQAETNTFDYKNKKYGMSEEDFNKYNSDRATTLENMIRRHGNEIGHEKWKKYKEKQSYVGCSKEYFIEKYGKVEGEKIYIEINNKKAQTLKNFVSRYGDLDGKKRYIAYMEDRNFGFSKIAKNLFDKIYSLFTDNKIYYMDMKNNKEFGIYDSSNSRYYFYDYIDFTLKKGIEFNGDVFHGNPSIFNSCDRPNPFNNDATCKKLWEYDAIKIKEIKKIHNIDILTIWESEYRNDTDAVIRKCIKFLKND